MYQTANDSDTFKFHCDSINIKEADELREQLKILNSTVILLI